MRFCFLLLIAVLGLAGPAHALEDTPDNRLIQAERYSKVMPLGELLNDSVQQISQKIPEDKRVEFTALMTKHLDIERLTKSVNEIMVKHFTADELAALADFYGSPVAKSAMKKFGAYMADAMPVIQAGMANAMSEAKKEKEAQQK